jgi:predicted nicotinamide N-methyase
MPGYLTKHESIAVQGVADLQIRSLLDRQQFSDPLGIAARAGISSASWPLFGLLWPSGLHLAAHLALRPVTVGERILEIGCGLGLASLVGHRRGADVTASDCHPLAGAFLAENSRLNGLTALKYRHGDWASAAVPLAHQVQGLFGLIMGSDVLYDRSASQQLAGFIGRHATARSEVWIVDPNRGNRAAFGHRMRDLGYTLADERLHTAPSATQPGYRGHLLVYRRAGPAAAPPRA